MTGHASASSSARWSGARAWLALVLSVAALALTIWIVIPAPNRTLLPLAVGAPELSPWLAVHSLFALVAAALTMRRHRTARIAFAAATLSLLLALVPLLQFSSVTERANADIERVFGVGLTTEVEATRPTLASLFGSIEAPGASAVRESRDVPFATTGGETLTMNVYRPAASGPHPVLVQVYGGAWQRGDPADFAEFARWVAARGYVVFATDYRHAPQHRFPAQLDDTRTALAWIGAHARGYDADTSRMVLMGRSAGAHLAMLAAFAPDSARVIPNVRGVISLYGPVDLTDGWRRPPSPDPLKVRTVEEAFLGGTPDELPGRYREASPITYATRPLPPVLLVYGARDHIVESRFGRLLHARLGASGTRSVLIELPWAEHAFDAVPAGPGGRIARWATMRFLASVTAKPQ